jgi:hypothetical protein
MTTSTAALTTLQLRRLAAAVDGCRTGDQVFVVMRTSGEAPFDVPLVDSDEFAATQTAQKRSVGDVHYDVFGPYQSQEDRDVTNRRDLDQLAIVLDHSPWSDPCVPRLDPKVRIPKLNEIEKVTLELQLKNNDKPVRIDCSHDNDGIEHPAPDAIFIGMAAYDKFFMPDYFRIYGPRETLKQRKEYLKVLKRAVDSRKDKPLQFDIKP